MRGPAAVRVAQRFLVVPTVVVLNAETLLCRVLRRLEIGLRQSCLFIRL